MVCESWKAEWKKYGIMCNDMKWCGKLLNTLWWFWIVSKWYGMIWVKNALYVGEKMWSDVQWYWKTENDMEWFEMCHVWMKNVVKVWNDAELHSKLQNDAELYLWKMKFISKVNTMSWTLRTGVANQLKLVPRDVGEKWGRGRKGVCVRVVNIL